MRHVIAPVITAYLLLSGGSLALAAGDIERGKTLALEKGCAGCHGVDGNSPNSSWPKIAGQNAKYMVRQLKAFKDNNLENLGRAAAAMTGFAQGLSEQDMEDISAFFANNTTTTGEADPDLAQLGYQIYRGGDKTKGVPSCMGCHGPTGAGNPASGYPSLAGQWAAYTEAQLLHFKAETRRNDQNRMMRDIASKMYPDEIEAVSSYIQGLHD